MNTIFAVRQTAYNKMLARDYTDIICRKFRQALKVINRTNKNRFYRLSIVSISEKETKVIKKKNENFIFDYYGRNKRKNVIK